MDSKAQAFAEEAITAIARDDVDGARTAVAAAYDADHTIGALADAIYLACSQLEEDGTVSTATWNTLADAVAPGPLVAVVEANRT